MTGTGSPIHFGFVTIVEIENVGFCGGLLVLNQVARPLEFHCTLPVKPSKAQQILFGSTLRPYLCGELIATSLVKKSKIRPHLLITDCPDTASLADAGAALVDTPTILFPTDDMNPPAAELPDWNSIELSGQSFLVANGQRDSAPEIKHMLAEFCQRNQLGEPFGRIRQAVGAAHQSARGAA